MSELVDRHSEICALPATEPVTAAARRMPPVPASRMRILCVDDDANVRGTLARLLKHLGHDVDLSCSGSEALQILASRSYDLVMPDTHLADMSGRDITRSIRTHGPIPVIWMTGVDHVAQGIIAADEPDSPSCILTKPLTLGALRKALDDIAAAAAATSAAT
jgi:CheY-like chemotaxis protein